MATVQKILPAMHARPSLRVAMVLLLSLSAAAALAQSPPPAAAPAAKAAAGRVAPGAEIAYDDLPAYVGSEIIVSTKLGTVRRARLTGASSISINLQLVPADGGFAMSMPRENVTRVVLAPAADAAADAKN